MSGCDASGSARMKPPHWFTGDRIPVRDTMSFGTFLVLMGFVGACVLAALTGSIFRPG